MLHYALKTAKAATLVEEEEQEDGEPMEAEKETATPGESSTAQMTSTGMTLRHEDKTSAGDNLEYLRSKLVWEMGDDGKERVCDADGNG